MSETGYLRFPSIAQDQVVFVSEDDLWTVPAQGGIARRLTSGLGAVGTPALSADGKWLAFAGREEGQTEVYCMPAAGGQPKRLTFLGGNLLVVGWNPEGKIVFASNTAQPFASALHLYAIWPAGRQFEQLPTGPALSISFGPEGGCVIGRNGMDPARWKRYRGGTAGDLWIDPTGTGEFHRLLQLPGNLAWPMWVAKRIYFLCDHEGVGNLYSCKPSGADVVRHTHHEDFYLRYPSSDGRRIVYQAGADLFLFDPKTNGGDSIQVEQHSPRTQRNRKFVQAAKYLQDYALHPQGHMVGVTARGKPFTMGNWGGPALQYGEPDGVRHRLLQWLHDGKRLALISDAQGEEKLEIHDAEEASSVERFPGLDLGQVYALSASPSTERVALSNHRNELVVVDLDTKKSRVIDHSAYAPMAGFDWSADGRWLAYSFAKSRQTAVIKLCNVDSQETFSITTPVLVDVAPVFDPDGKYLYFLSYREFDPVYDNMHFDLGFPRGVRPYLLTLQRDEASPFIPVPQAEEKDDAESDEHKKDDPDRLEIDLDGIEKRVVAFPVPEARYAQIAAISGKVLFSSLPIEGSLKRNFLQEGSPPAKAKLEAYDLKTQKRETLVSSLTSFKVSMDGKTLIYRAGNKLRVQKAGEKADEKTAQKPPSRESGWIDLSRLKVSVEPPLEWRQMMREAWRLQRDHFWDENMAQVNWEAVYKRYSPLLDRVATRGEFSDLMWEMQGELGTSHAYEFGGDYRPEPDYAQGFLGADFAYDDELGVWRIVHIVFGDPWNDQSSSPFLRPGINVQEGDTLLTVAGRPVDASTSPQQLLVNQANSEVSLTVGDAKGKAPRTVIVKTLSNETPARYRDWVEQNRAYVHEQTKGRAGYVHIPDMGPRGYAEFHRYFLAEIDREGLVVDVRFNGGGHVSELLLEKLVRKRIAYIKTRWHNTSAYPRESVAGPMVALTNEYAGSDGDIFSHGFKMLKLGPLIGKRTWGGVIGISPSQRLIDGGVTSQPEFAFWFTDVGWNVENYGTDPDIEVEMRPQDHVAGIDAQLDRGIEEILKLFETHPPSKPAFEAVPSRALPKLPK